MTLAPRAVLVHRRTELQELLERHGTRAQAAFFLETRGRRLEDVTGRHEAVEAAIAAVTSSIPAEWRRGQVERADLPRFLFAPGDIIVAVGQDGLVANIAKYLDGQIVIGINPEPARNPGLLVPHPPQAAPALLATAAGPRSDGHVERRTMVEAVTDDGQQLIALNEIYIGQASHQTARYTLTLPGGQAEPQASSGLIVSTGTGATGWGRSAWLERKSTLVLPAPAEERLTWFVREAWPSPATGTACTEGDLAAGQSLAVSAESDLLVLFGDGIEADAIPLAWGQAASIRLAPQTLRLLRDAQDEPVEPFTDRAQRVVVERIHGRGLEAVPGGPGVPALPDRGRARLRHVPPGGQRVLLQQPVRGPGMAVGAQDRASCPSWRGCRRRARRRSSRLATAAARRSTARTATRASPSGKAPRPAAGLAGPLLGHAGDPADGTSRPGQSWRSLPRQTRHNA